jgi:hypothetical protein
MIEVKISETAIPPEIAEKRVHPLFPVNIKPVIYRIAITEKTGRLKMNNHFINICLPPLPLPSVPVLIKAHQYHL